MRFGDGATGCFGRAPHLQSTSLIALFASCSWAAGRWRAHGKRLAALLAISALNFALASGFQASADDFQGLGTLGGTNSYAVSVSADGTAVVGYSFVAGDAAYHAFGWSGGTMSDLGTLGGSYSQALGVSSNGAVVVGWSLITGDTTGHAFRLSGGIVSDLGTLAGGTYSRAYAVNADGSVVVGYSATSGTTLAHAFRWSSGTMNDLGTLGGSTSFGYGVSAGAIA